MRRPRILLWLGLIVVLSFSVISCGGGSSGDGGSNNVPVANAGSNQNLATGSTVNLDGSSCSDADGDTLIYSWSFISKPPSSSTIMSNPAAVSPTFVADLDGTYVLSLVVNDGTVNSAADAVTITAVTPNNAPAADAGPNQNVSTGSTVTLDASGSSDANGDTLTYSWSFTSMPGGSSAVLSDSTSIGPTFTADIAGTYVLSLIVNDGTVNSAADAVTITAINAAPVANAGPDQNVSTGSFVTLDGSGSSDPNGDTLTYSWVLVSRPSGSTVALSFNNIVNPSFVPDVAGTYVVSLVVNDGTVSSTADAVVVTATNVTPVADAGPNQNVSKSSLVTLDGSGSSDTDGDSLTYSWSFSSIPGGSGASLSNATSASPTFTTDVAGTYVVSLVVNDGTVSSTADAVTVTVTNTPPVANAGPDQNVETGTHVTIDGSASADADGDSLGYLYVMESMPSGSSAALSYTSNAHFWPDVDGTYVISLRVTDGTVWSSQDTVTITATTSNAPPVANAGSDQDVSKGSLVTLDGSGSSDADGDSLTYSWSFASIPSGSGVIYFGSSMTANPTFTPDVAGSYVISLVVNDGNENSAVDTVTVSATNTAPIADAGPDQYVTIGSLVNLNGNNSSDADGDVLTYSWYFTSLPTGSSATLQNPTTATPYFTPDTDGIYAFGLLVNDGESNGYPDEIRVLVLADTELDTSFGTGGVSFQDSGILDDFGYSVAIQPDDKAVVSGFSDNGTNYDLMLWKYNTDGSLDTSFGTDGVVRYDGGWGNDRGMSAASQSDGKTVVAGWSQVGADFDLVLFRFNADGTPDSTFGSNGMASYDGGFSDAGYSVAVQSDGKIVVAGDSHNGTDYDLLLVRYNTNGTLDTTFGSDGVVQYDGGYEYEGGKSVAIQSDGKILVTGESSTPGSPQLGYVLWRFNADGSPDMTFGTGGMTNFNVGSSDYSWSVAIQPDGKAILVGYSFNGSDFDIVVVRANADGTLDTSFGVNGVVRYDGGYGHDFGRSVAIQADGKILVVGERGGGTEHDVVLIRLTSDGSFHTTFDYDGVTIFDGGKNDRGRCVAIRSDGDALVTGESLIGTNYDLLLAKFNTSVTNDVPVANAGADQNVSVGEFVTLDGSGSSDVDGDSLTYNWSFTSIPGGSGVVLSGSTAVNPTFTPDVVGTYVISLVVNDGTVNSGIDTVIVTAANTPPVADAGPDQNVAKGALVTLDGSGSSDADGDSLSYSWSFTSVPDGSNATFSSASVVGPTLTADLAGTYVISLVVNDGTANSTADAVTVTATNTPPVADAGPDQIVATGSTVTLDGSGSSDANGDSLNYSWVMVSRPTGSSATLSFTNIVNPSFMPDFSGNYVMNLVVGDGDVSSIADAVTVIASNIPIANAGPNQDIVTGSLVFLDGSGSTDADGDFLTYSWTFSSLPVGSSANLSGGNDTNPTFIADVDGTYVISLIVYDGTLNSETDLVTINATSAVGMLDTSFGINGIMQFDNGFGDDVGYSVAIQADGKILVAGDSTDGTDSDLVLWRYQDNGTLDNSFGTGGVASYDFGNYDHGKAVAIQSDGKLLVSGYIIDSNYELVLARFNDNGTLDTTFGTNGIARGDDVPEIGMSVKIQADGKILVAGNKENGTDSDLLLARFTANGILDTTFGVGGVVQYDGGGSHDYGFSLAIQSDGKALVAGRTGNTLALLRFTTHGTLDPTFGSGGVIQYSDDDYGVGRSIVIQPDGKIIVAGESRVGSFYDLILVRYTTDGMLDSTFGTSGVVRYSVGSSNTYGTSAAIQNDGKIIVTGYGFVGTNDDVVLVRFTNYGILDSTFGTGGLALYDGGFYRDHGRSLTILPDGKVVVAGDSWIGPTSSGDYDLLIVKFE